MANDHDHKLALRAAVLHVAKNARTEDETLLMVDQLAEVLFKLTDDKAQLLRKFNEILERRRFGDGEIQRCRLCGAVYTPQGKIFACPAGH